MKKNRTHTENRHNRHTYLVALLAVFMACSLIGCGAAVDYDEAATENAAADGGMTGETDPGTSEAAQTNEKIIYTYNYTVETKQFDTFIDTVQKRISEYGGYLESSDTNGNADLDMTRYANMVIRIPSDKMKQFLSMVEENSNVTYAGCSTENVTLDYVDLQSHVKALKTEQETLLGLLERAEKLEDVLALQAQLTDVRYQLESYESQLRVYDNRIDYATLYLDINEVERETKVGDKLSYGEEIRQGLSNTFYLLGQNLREFSIWFIVNLPVLLLWAVIVIVVVWVVRKVRKWSRKRKLKKAQREEAKEDKNM